MDKVGSSKLSSDSEDSGKLHDVSTESAESSAAARATAAVSKAFDGDMNKVSTVKPP